MALSERVRQNNFDRLLEGLGEAYSAEAYTLLSEINARMAEEDIPLADQSDRLKQILFRELDTHQSIDIRNEGTVHVALDAMQAALNHQLQIETEEARRRTAAQPEVEDKPIHQRSLHAELQDDDMLKFMPKSESNIDVLAPADRINISAEIPAEGLRAALAKDNIDHIFMPVGPGHWRGVYISKPEEAGEKYKVEIFDPKGPQGADTIVGYVQDVLRASGIDLDDVELTKTGPIHRQTEDYACGDFVCAYSHKMKNNLATEGTYNADYIRVLDIQGNRDDSLRQFTRSLSAADSIEAHFHPVGEALPEVDLHEAIRSNLNESEQKIYDQTIEKYGKNSYSNEYKLELAELIKQRHEIYQKANDVMDKESKGEELTDEELAIKFQAEEFDKDDEDNFTPSGP